jgi:peroxiredoxin Q/BCP
MLMAAKKVTKAGKVSRRATPVAAGRAAPSAGAKSSLSKPSTAKKAAKKVTAAKRAPAPNKPRTAASARVAEPAATGSLGEGDRAPSFQLLDQSGQSRSSAELSGQPYVLYFYPKDDTPGCTTQACGFRDALPAFERLGVSVLGVSPDSSSSHERFRAKYALPFTLLSDADKELATAYGVWALKKNYGREYMGVVRSTFLVGSDGVIRKVWRGVKVNGHVEQVQAAAATLG